MFGHTLRKASPEGNKQTVKASRSKLAATLTALRTMSIGVYIWPHLCMHLAAAHRVRNAYLMTDKRDSRDQNP